MNKLKLDLETLDVQSFVTQADAEEQGTVQAHIGTFACDTVNNTCDGAATCGGFTCRMVNYSCAPSCTGCDTYECSGEGTTLGTVDGTGSGIMCNTRNC